MITPWQAWLLDPRDPLVLGDGSRNPPRSPFLMPPPSALAGYVRTAAWQDDVQKFEQDVRPLLDFKVRGPWLVDTRTAEPFNRIWVPPPADVTVADTHGEVPVLQLPARVGPASDDVGALWDEASLWPVDLPERVQTCNGRTVKTRPLGHPVWTLDHALDWSLCSTCTLDTTLKKDRILAEERRTHVALQPDTGTAKPEALFTSAGVRLHPEFRYGLETTATLPPTERLQVLGGEGRQVRRSLDPQGWPAFPKSRYEAALQALQAQGGEILLRLQLLTPGCFQDGWRPPPLTGLTLKAALVPSPIPISGWDLKKRAHRQVRRLVPAGAIYWYHCSHDDLISKCLDYWTAHLPGTPADIDNNLASAEHDGFGQVLPGFTLVSKEQS